MSVVLKLFPVANPLIFSLCTMPNISETTAFLSGAQLSSWMLAPSSEIALLTQIMLNNYTFEGQYNIQIHLHVTPVC